ncbi:MAG: hypothetical protein ABL893_00885 [Hyphomicrobium sp.]|nr:hypothetical protein [Hyphomicrobium sp.]
MAGRGYGWRDPRTLPALEDQVNAAIAGLPGGTAIGSELQTYLDRLPVDPVKTIKDKLNPGAQNNTTTYSVAIGGLGGTGI